MAVAHAIAFADLLRRYRVAAGLTQEDLAERAGLSPKDISDLERGARTHPRRDTVHLLAAALGLTDADRTTFEAAARQRASAPAASSIGSGAGPMDLLLATKLYHLAHAQGWSNGRVCWIAFTKARTLPSPSSRHPPASADARRIVSRAETRRVDPRHHATRDDRPGASRPAGRGTERHRGCVPRSLRTLPRGCCRWRAWRWRARASA